MSRELFLSLILFQDLQAIKLSHPSIESILTWTGIDLETGYEVKKSIFIPAPYFPGLIK